MTPALNSARLDASIRISEINYNGGRFDDVYESDLYEFVEIVSIDSNPSGVDLHGLVLASSEGPLFTFEDHVVLRPAEYLVICRNMAAFKSRYFYVPSKRVTGGFAGGRGLVNRRDVVTLSIAESGVVISSISYDDRNGWPVEADG